MEVVKVRRRGKEREGCQKQDTSKSDVQDDDM